MPYIGLPDKALLCPCEVAEYLRVRVRTVYRWIADGALYAIRVGGLLRIPRWAVEEFQKSASE